MTTLTLDQLSYRARRGLALDESAAAVPERAGTGPGALPSPPAPHPPVTPFRLLPPPRDSEVCSVPGRRDARRRSYRQ